MNKIKIILIKWSDKNADNYKNSNEGKDKMLNMKMSEQTTMENK